MKKILTEKFLGFGGINSVETGNSSKFHSNTIKTKEKHAMARGKVKWFSNPKGYGFITGDDGTDTFVHFTAIEGTGYRTLEENQVVEYSVVDGEKGKQAASVRKIVPLNEQQGKTAEKVA